MWCHYLVHWEEHGRGEERRITCIVYPALIDFSKCNPGTDQFEVQNFILKSNSGIIFRKLNSNSEKKFSPGQSKRKIRAELHIFIPQKKQNTIQVQIIVLPFFTKSRCRISYFHFSAKANSKVDMEFSFFTFQQKQKANQMQNLVFSLFSKSKKQIRFRIWNLQESKTSDKFHILIPQRNAERKKGIMPK